MTDEPIFDFDEPQPRPRSQRRQYNLITDTVIGPNVRWKDNLYQGISILVCLFLGAGIGALCVKDRALGVILGGFIGLLTGLFGSGIFLMIYRAIAHARGRHD
jgi:hypothetical protein